MLRNYFILTWRNLSRRKFYSTINILGLSLGLTAAAILILYTRHEKSYDKFHSSADRIYRVSGQNETTWFAALFASYSNGIYKGEFPEVETTARLRRWTPRFMKYGEDKFFEKKILITDPGSTFFSLFDFPFIAGNANDALKYPYSVVLTASIAEKFFGKSDPMGQTLIYDTLSLTVTGVIKDLPSNTHFDFKILVTDAKKMNEASAMFTYCLLRDNTNIQQFESRIMGLPKPENKHMVLKKVSVQQVPKLHFESEMTYEMKPKGSRAYLLLFNLVGLLIVVLSCSNYMNLSIAMYAERKKEIAVRKVVGAGNLRLALQFIGEAVCISLLCLPLTWVLLELSLPWFNQFMQISLHNDFSSSFTGFGILMGVTVMMGIISGLYPALVLPKLKAITLFKKINIASRGGLNMRWGLVTFQVSILVMIISGSWIIYNQMGYLQQKDLGFKKEGVLKLTGASWVDSSQYYTLKNELLKNPAIKSVSNGFAPGDEDYGVPFKGPASPTVYNDLISFGTDYDFPSTLGLEVVQADFTDISKEKPKRLVLINETLAQRLGYKDAIGKQVILSPGDRNRAYTINGVVKDFHFFSLHRAVSPMVFFIRPFGGGISENILINIETTDLAGTLAFINKQTNALIPQIPLTPQFLDDSLDQLYNKEQKLATISQVSLFITLFLSVIGLMGLAAYLVELRTKEVGIRKILGASTFSILRLLSFSFTRMAILAIIIGSSLSVILMNQWLKNFEYKTTISWMVFAGTAVILLLIIMIAIGTRTVKAAISNPVKSLRTE